MDSHPARVLSLVITVTGAAVGCVSPSPIVRLTPRAPNVFWVNGRASVAKEENGVRVAVAFEHQDGSMLEVRVEVQNLTDGPLDVKPQDFSYVACSGGDVRSCGPARRLVDPEGMLAALDVNESVERANAVNEQTAMASLMLLSLAADVAGAASGHRVRGSWLWSDVLATQMGQDEARHDSRAASIGAQRQLWSNAAFRRNTLAPGGGAGGNVYIPIETKVRYLWLTVRAGQRLFPFCFEQVAIEVEPGAVAVSR